MRRTAAERPRLADTANPPLYEQGFFVFAGNRGARGGRADRGLAFPIAGTIAERIAPSGADPRHDRKPTPSLPDTSPFGQIGKLERNRTTTPSQLEPFLKSSDLGREVARAAIAIGRLRKPWPASRGFSLRFYRRRILTMFLCAAAAFALGVIASPGCATGVALGRVAGDAPPAVAGSAADSLGRIGGPSAVETLSSLISSRDAFMRGKAAIGLGESGFASKPQISQPLKATTGKLLDNAFTVERDPETRWRMAWAIYRSYFDTNPGLLRTMLADQQELVRMYGVKAIGRLQEIRRSSPPCGCCAKDPSCGACAWR